MLPSLQHEIKRLAADSAVVQFGLALHDLSDGSELLLRPDRPFHPASTFKLAVMVEVFHQASLGELSLDDLLPVRNEFASLADGSPFSLSEVDDSEVDLYTHIGQSLSLRDLVFRMIAWSSNLATCLLVEKVTAARVTRFMRDLGIPGLVVLRGPEDNKAYALGLNNSATPRSLMQLLLQLALEKVVSPAASKEMLSMLLRQQFNEGIPAALPPDVLVAHKTGWNDHLYHDAAVIFPPAHAPYILVVMTGGLSEFEAAPALVSAVSAACFHALISASLSES
jgi:beta-lactamase class A